MNAVGPLPKGDVDNPASAELRRCRSTAFAKTIGLVRLEPMQGKLVLFGICRDRADAELGRGTKHANRDPRG